LQKYRFVDFVITLEPSGDHILNYIFLLSTSSNEVNTAVLGAIVINFYLYALAFLEFE